MIGSQQVAQMLRIHTQSQIEGGHTFSPLSFCSIGIQATKAFQMPAMANVYGSRGIHLPRSTQADHSRHVCGNEFTCSAHGCFKGTSQQESVGNSQYIYIYIYVVSYIYIYTHTVYRYTHNHPEVDRICDFQRYHLSLFE